ncbi:ABC transporter permease [Tahibacter sp. UC22_41]|uniref:ABC transporter permease n=1 Tax=Tahibacter sp. UC22_41 TaxID=3350178 RepID=UPI002CC7A21E|nr:ABC transporter permease [Tahibacter sp.]
MTKTGFVIANLFRKKTRTVLTLLSVIMAFLLFGLLQAVNVMFNAGADFVGATRLITQSRVSFTQSLPLRQLPELEAVPGVEAVMYEQWFGGVWQENTQLIAFAVDPERLHKVYPEWTMPEDAWKKFAQTRTGMIAGRQIAKQYGWEVGQKLPIKSSIFPQKDGSKAWSFDLVGIYDGKDEEWQRQTSQVFINFAYFDEANQFGSGRAGIYVLKLGDPDKAKDVALTIDKKYENSTEETKTQTEKDWNAGFAKQMGDIGMLVRWILFAVFFTLLLVVGNTMAQSVRERIPELAVLKTLGFSDGSVLGFVLAEALLIVGAGGLIGLGLATGLGILVQKNAGAMLPISVDWRVWSVGLIAIAVVGTVVGLLPALRAQRLKIVDALAGR